MNDTTLLNQLLGNAETQAPRARFPLWSYGLAALVFAFVIGFGESSDPNAARVILALSATAAAFATMSLLEIFFSLRGRRASSLAAALPSHAALDEEKRQVLTAIKELDFDRAMNKIDLADFEEMRGRYESDALRVLKAIGEEQDVWREKANALLSKHLKDKGVSMGAEAAKREGKPASSKKKATSSKASEVAKSMAGSRCPSCKTDNEADAHFCKRCGSRIPLPQSCKACQTPNEADAEFCTRCGDKLGEEAAS